MPWIKEKTLDELVADRYRGRVQVKLQYGPQTFVRVGQLHKESSGTLRIQTPKSLATIDPNMVIWVKHQPYTRISVRRRRVWNDE